MKFVVKPSANLGGRIKVAGDKSVSHRSIMFGSIAQGVTRVSEILEAEDVLATIDTFRQMGVEVNRVADKCYEIHGKGLNGLSQPQQPLDMGNSGTAFRLMSGLLCAQPWSCQLIGDESLSQRPMGRIIDPLTLMGAQIISADGKPPLSINPALSINAIEYRTPMASAQVKSAVLLAGLYAEGETAVVEESTTRDHTERMLQGFGYEVKIEHNSNQKVCRLRGGGSLQARDIEVPADLSSAAFFMVAGLIAPNSELILQGVGMNPSRNGVVGLLQRMNANLSIENERTAGGEPVADIRIRSSHLQGCKIEKSDVALAIDEIPVLAVAAACASGTTTIRGAEELRVKESDRIHSTVQGLKSLSVKVEEFSDGMQITGGNITGGSVESFLDHRISMAFAIAGIAASEEVEILDCDNVATSFPDFAELADAIGVSMTIC